MTEKQETVFSTCLYTFCFIFLIAIAVVQFVDIRATDIETLIRARNKEQSLFLKSASDKLELHETLHSKQNETDMLRSELQGAAQDNEALRIYIDQLETEIENSDYHSPKKKNIYQL